MMKKLFLLLVMVNILLFAAMRWGGGSGSNEASSPVQSAMNADKIKLLAQAPQPVSAAIPASAVAVALAASAPAPAQPMIPIPQISKTDTNVCLEWGEFSGTDLARSEQALAAMKLGDHLGQRSVEYASGYWVYIPPQKTHKGVKKKIAQLKERGVTDYFVVQEEGPWLNAVSLGVFKTEEAAQKYLSSLKERDVRSARVGERVSKLKFIVHVLKHLDAATNLKVAAMLKDFPDSTLKTVTCD